MGRLEYLKYSYDYYFYELESLNRVSSNNNIIFSTSASALLVEKMKEELRNKLKGLKKEIDLLESVLAR